MALAEHPKPKSLTDDQRHWLTHIEAASAEGLTLKEYAQQYDLPLQKLYGWKSSLKKRGLLAQDKEPVSFAPVHIVNADIPCALRIRLPNGVAIEVLSPVAEPVLLGVLCAASQLP
ncbi:MAG: hypothetical protein GY731_08480 [Gammaproteobacteria bacterium]|nr:hypothetical protein [Gammaproteobacteria bacterium]